MTSSGKTSNRDSKHLLYLINKYSISNSGEHRSPVAQCATISRGMESEDEQLARALAASLEVQDKQRFVARTDQEEDEALLLAVAASLAEHEEQQQQQQGAPGGSDPACNTYGTVVSWAGHEVYMKPSKGCKGTPQNGANRRPKTFQDDQDLQLQLKCSPLPQPLTPCTLVALCPLLQVPPYTHPSNLQAGTALHLDSSSSSQPTTPRQCTPQHPKPLSRPTHPPMHPTNSSSSSRGQVPVVEPAGAEAAAALPLTATASQTGGPNLGSCWTRQYRRSILLCKASPVSLAAIHVQGVAEQWGLVPL